MRERKRLQTACEYAMMRANPFGKGKGKMKAGRQFAWVTIAALLVVVIVLAIIYVNREMSQSAPEPLPQENEQSGEPETGDQPTDGQPEDETTEIPADGDREEPERELRYQSYGNGTCCVLGPGTVRESCLIIPKTSPDGDRVIKIAARAFFGCDEITVVQIPETVLEIGEFAFADCRNLVYLAVASRNSAYCDVDGVLYSADRSCLIQYPPMRVGDPLTIPVSVTAVSAMAFYRCQNLKSVRYEGSGEEWEGIQIGKRNYDLIAASIQFSRYE